VVDDLDALLPEMEEYVRYIDSGHARPGVRAVTRLYGRIIPLLPKPHIIPDPCDILLLSPSPSWARRMEPLEAALRARGVSFRHVVRPTQRAIIRNRLYAPSTMHIPHRWRYLAGYAERLLATYRPRVIVQFTDSDPLSYFIALSSRLRGIRTVNISHAVLVPHVLKSMFCFDFYFVFGRSSIQGAERSSVRFGSSKLVETGYLLLDRQLEMPPRSDGNAILFFSTWLYNTSAGFARAYDSAAMHCFETIAEWAKKQRRYELVVRPHPDEDPSLVTSRLGHLPNVKILPKSVSMAESLRMTSAAIGMVTNASIEAAVANRPFTSVFPAGVWDGHLDLEKYYGRRATNADELSMKLDRQFEYFDSALDGCHAYAKHHLAYTFDSMDVVTNCLVQIKDDREDFQSRFLPSVLAGMRRF